MLLYNNTGVWGEQGESLSCDKYYITGNTVFYRQPEAPVDPCEGLVQTTERHFKSV